MLQRKSRKILIYFFIFLAIGSLNNKNLTNINFAKINTIIISGLDDKNNIEIKNNLDFLKIYNLFFLNESKIKKILNENTLVENYSVFKNYPSTLNIKIDKTKFLAKIKKEKNNFFLGSNGKLTKVDNFEEDIPFIFGNFKNKDFFALKDAIDGTEFNYNQIKNLYFFKSGRWDVETNSGLLIQLPKENLKKSLKLLNNFMSLSHNKKIDIIDLRQNNQIIINGK